MIDEEPWKSQGGGEEILCQDLHTREIVCSSVQEPLSEIELLISDDLADHRPKLHIDNSTAPQQYEETDRSSDSSYLFVDSGSSTQKDKENVPASCSDGDSRCSELEPNNKKKKRFDLETYLRSIADGKYILGYFQEHKKLEAPQRSLLTRVIIKSFTDDALKTVPVGQKLENFTISSTVFKELANAIALLFPGEEVGVHYIPFKSENGKRVPTSGGLWEHYNYSKEVLRKKNLLIRTKELETTNKPQYITVEDAAKVSWLEANVSPWSKVSEYWLDTFAIRRRRLTVDHLSVAAYINLFPCLKLQGGKQLIQQDFEKLFPGKNSSLLSRWNVIKGVLIQQLQTNKTKNVDERAYIKLLPALPSEAQDAVILHLLTLLVDAGRPGRPKKNQVEEAAEGRKYSQLERREFFIHHVETSSDIDESLERFKERILKVKLTLQPIPVLVGSLTKIDQVFVRVEDQKYEVSSCLEALDLTFKLFFVLDCQYPKPSLTLWQFVQVAGFDIHIPGDRLVKSVNILLGLIKQAFSEKQ